MAGWGISVRGGFGRALFEGVFKRAYDVEDEAGVNGERGMWIVLVKRGWRLGVSVLCRGEGR
ncbi:hypothetical protein [Bartonella schoenbuchensis]|nr:hypothetical protein [Bartonella schoenbuchensis]CBI82933.1 hypothetical protein BARSC_190206 [Bartonella schoenbuchensis R1]